MQVHAAQQYENFPSGNALSQKHEIWDNMIKMNDADFHTNYEYQNDIKIFAKVEHVVSSFLNLALKKVQAQFTLPRTNLVCMKNAGTQWTMISYFKK